MTSVRKPAFASDRSHQREPYGLPGNVEDRGQGVRRNNDPRHHDEPLVPRCVLSGKQGEAQASIQVFDLPKSSRKYIGNYVWVRQRRHLNIYLHGFCCPQDDQGEPPLWDTASQITVIHREGHASSYRPVNSGDASLLHANVIVGLTKFIDRRAA